jgi:NADPH2:quinone reductase
MKTFQTSRLSGLKDFALADAAAPEPEAGEIVLAPAAIGVQLSDLALASGQRVPSPGLPFVPGMEAAGTVTAVAKGIRGFKVGDKAVAFLGSGGLAEAVRAKSNLCVPLPATLSADIAAILPHNYAGTLVALRDRAVLKPGDILLVLGAGGAAGGAAIEVGKQLGAKVIAVANGADRLEAAKELGADHVIDSGNATVGDEVPKLTGGARADVIFDPISGEAAIAAFPAGAIGMRYVLAGFAGGSVPRLDPALLFARDAILISANTHRMAEHEPDRMRKALLEVVGWAVDGKIKPRVAAKFALKDARHAFDYLAARRALGGVVVTI